MSTLVQIDHDRRLYVLNHHGQGYTCWGFENIERRRRAVLKWMREPCPGIALGTADHYAACQEAIERGAQHASKTGTRCNCDLTKELIGLEGRWVSVYDPAQGTVEVFRVGKSTGWMPCHLVIESEHDSGGIPVSLPDGAIVMPLAGNGEGYRQQIEARAA